MPMVRAMRMINAVEAGTLDGATLEALLTDDAGRQAELDQFLVLRGHARRMAAASTTMQAMAHSNTAMASIINAPVALYEVTQSPAAMAQVIDSPLAMSAMSANDVSRAALRASSMAIAAMEASQSVALVPWITKPAGLNPSDYASLSDLMADAGAWDAIIGSTEAMRSLFEFQASTAALIGNGTRLSQAVASSSIMGVLRGQAAGLSVFAESVAAKMAMFNSDIALTSIAGSSSAMEALRAASAYTKFATESTTGSRAFDADVSGSYIVVGASILASASGKTISVTTKKVDSTRPTSLVAGYGVYSSSSATGTLMCPVVAPFTVSTDYAAATALYVGALRCDV